MPTKHSTEQPASRVSDENEPVSITAKEQNNAAEDSAASQEESRGTEASGSSSKVVESVKEDDTATKARQRQERFKALQARAVGFSFFFLPRLCSLGYLRLSLPQAHYYVEIRN